MKNYSILFMAAMACMLAGCAGKQLLEDDSQEITIEAVMAENNPTRTVISLSNVSMKLDTPIDFHIITESAPLTKCTINLTD